MTRFRNAELRSAFSEFSDFRFGVLNFKNFNSPTSQNLKSNILTGERNLQVPDRIWKNLKSNILIGERNLKVSDRIWKNLKSNILIGERNLKVSDRVWKESEIQYSYRGTQSESFRSNLKGIWNPYFRLGNAMWMFQTEFKKQSEPCRIKFEVE